MKLKLNEILQLNQELQQLLNEKISMPLRFKVLNTLKEISNPIETYFKIHNTNIEGIEGINDYNGVPFDKIPENIKKQYFEKTEGEKELLLSEIEVDFSLKLKDIEDIKTNFNYQIIFKFII